MNHEHQALLNTGAVQARTLSEALAIDQPLLMRTVWPDAPDALHRAVAEADPLGILQRMRHIGTALAAFASPQQLDALSRHSSDTVRGWVCFALAVNDEVPPNTLLRVLEPFADDTHFTVREWVWMAARPTLVEELETSITLLTRYTSHPSPRMRRFASEALRPRGVWASHIAALKRNPDMGLPLLEPLRSDPEKYVQDSVSNWINDAAKDQPDWARELCARWLAESPTPATERIAKRGLRSLT
ncbi:DNA alkylation repair protein [Leucobacter chinensis]|uniref:DNA alkylation repair protein n=1 Tax=Leucobacter chinensis TaxID=2851010 RepID=UPI00350F96D9